MTDETIPIELLPCPFCGGDNIEIHEKYMPPVMNRKPSVISVEVRHFCPKRKSQPHGMSVKQIGRDRESAIDAWNTRQHTEHQKVLEQQEELKRFWLALKTIEWGRVPGKPKEWSNSEQLRDIARQALDYKE